MEANMKTSIRKWFSVIAIVLSLCFAFSATGCLDKPDSNGGESESTSESTGTETTISFSCGETLTMDEWTTQRLTVSASDKSAVTLKADDASMLYLRGSNVTALKAGSTTITATAGKKKDVTAKLNVTINAKAENRPVLSLLGSGEIAIGKTEQYGASLSGVEAGDYVVTYATENPAVATVDAEGKVTALTAGKTKLTAATTYRSVQFKAEKDIVVSQMVKVVFAENEEEAKLAVSEIREDLTGEYEVEINGKKYTADGDGNITLAKADFDLTSGNTFDGKITAGANVYEFKLVVYAIAAPAVYQDGVALKPDENGGISVDKSKPADENGLRWITFDDANTMLDAGYEILKIKVKFNAFCNVNAGVVDSTIAAYHYNFGYKYVEYTDDPETGDLVWLFWDNDYQGKAYGGAMKPAYHAPYGYGYLKILDASGNLLLDYYQKQITDASGTHGNWSDYITPLQTGVEYTFLLDVSKTHDISFSGLDDAVITGIEWTKKVETSISFESETLAIDEWEEATVRATVNDGSAVEYAVSDPSVLYLSGNKIVGLKAGTAKVTATANGVKAELTVTVNANEANRPAIDVSDVELTEGESVNLAATVTAGGKELTADLYTIAYTTEYTDDISVSGNVLNALKAGNAEVLVTVTYCGKTFTAKIAVTVKAAEKPVDNSKGKLYQNGVEIAAAEDGSFTPDATAEVKTLTFDPYAAKNAFGMRRLRFTVKFKSFAANVLRDGYEFGYTYGDVSVLFDNDYHDGMYAGAFKGNDGSPVQFGYVSIYTADGKKYFEHYTCENWSSSGFGYVPALAPDTEYTFDIDIEKTGDITLYGFENAVFTKIEWVDYNNVTIAFGQEKAEADEWEWFDFSATTSDALATLTFSSDNEEVLYVKGNKAIGLKAGTANVVAKNSAGKSVSLPVTIAENAANRPVFDATADATVEVLGSVKLNVTLKSGETVISSDDYELNATPSTDCVKFENGVLVGVKAGSAKVIVRAIYCGAEFTDEIDITVTEVADPSVGKLYQNGVELKADANGKYKVDTTVAGDANGLHWLTVDSAKTSVYTYLRFTVKFDSFVSYKKMTDAQYNYNFGYNYGSATVFYDNMYASGGFGGALDAGGNAQNEKYYWNVYTASDNVKVLDVMDKTGWSPYYTLQTGVEYVFEFNVKAMGESFTMAGFETATISNVTWAEAMLG